MEKKEKRPNQMDLARGHSQGVLAGRVVRKDSMELRVTVWDTT